MKMPENDCRDENWGGDDDGRRYYYVISSRAYPMRRVPRGTERVLVGHGIYTGASGIEFKTSQGWFPIESQEGEIVLVKQTLIKKGRKNI